MSDKPKRQFIDVRGSGSWFSCGKCDARKQEGFVLYRVLQSTGYSGTISVGFLCGGCLETEGPVDDGRRLPVRKKKRKSWSSPL